MEQLSISLGTTCGLHACPQSDLDIVSYRRIYIAPPRS